MRLLTKVAGIALLPISLATAAPQTSVLDVQNMTCPLCGVTVKQSLKKLPGVEAARIDYDTKTATVKYDAAKVNISSMLKATADAGFPASLHK